MGARGVGRRVAEMKHEQTVGSHERLCTGMARPKMGAASAPPYIRTGCSFP